MTVSVIFVPSLQELEYWINTNLGLSVIPFSLVLLAYFHSLNRLTQILKGDPNSSQVAYLEQKLNICISLFLGIGIVWTTIGLRSALIQSLSGLTAETAAPLGAFEILSRMKTEGILVSLSTTILGAIGEYTLRLIKIWQVGEALDNYYYAKASQQSKERTDQLDSINHDVIFIHQPIKSLYSGENTLVSIPEINTRDPPSRMYTLRAAEKKYS